MPNLDQRRVISNLQRKGFEFRETSNHHQLVYKDRDGSLTTARTSLSRGRKEISSKLVSQMARDVELSTQEFCELVKCPLGQDEYHRTLQNKGIAAGRTHKKPQQVVISESHREKIREKLSSWMNNDNFEPEYLKIYGLLEENPVDIEIVHKLEDLGFDVRY